MVLAYVNWDKVKKDVIRAISAMYTKDNRFVKSRDIADHILTNQDQFNQFKGCGQRAVKLRITEVMDQHIKWPVYSSNGNGKTYVKPDSWE